MNQVVKKRDNTGAKAAIEISRWIEPWGESRFPVDVDFLARGAHAMYGWDRVQAILAEDASERMSKTQTRGNPRQHWRFGQT